MEKTTRFTLPVFEQKETLRMTFEVPKTVCYRALSKQVTPSTVDKMKFMRN